MTGRNGYPAGTLGGLLAARRRRQLVGRVAELDLFRAAMDGDDLGFRVLFVYGPGGVGKRGAGEALGLWSCLAGHTLLPGGWAWGARP